MTDQLCTSCQRLKPVESTDSVGRAYCAECMEMIRTAPLPTNLLILAATIPFDVGDRVEARTAGVLYEGIGVIDEISTDIKNWGTPVYPSFHVVFEKKAYPEVPDAVWFMETQLRKVGAE